MKLRRPGSRFPRGIFNFLVSLLNLTEAKIDLLCLRLNLLRLGSHFLKGICDFLFVILELLRGRIDLLRLRLELRRGVKDLTGDSSDR